MQYFVTGATGFIGRRLVKKLLTHRDSTVYFLVREAHLSKVPDLLQYWGTSEGRAVPVLGDLQKKGLGISEVETRQFINRIDHFFHLAAIYDLNAGAAIQFEVNQEGTRQVVAFAHRINAKLFHHVSSIAAAGLYKGVFREDMFDEAEHLDHPYFASKHQAEKIVRCEAKIPYRIYRPGMVVGDSVTGEADKVDGPYYLVIRVIPWDFFLAFCQIEFSAEEQNAHAVVFE